MTHITPITKFDGWSVKREDLACWTSLEYPSGSKVRQYSEMAAKTAKIPHLSLPEYAPCIVGCSANSCMQVYVAATAKILNTKGIIYTAARKVRSDATLYAESMGAEIVEVKPGYLSVIKQRAHQRASELGQVVQWNPNLAIQDVIQQCQNIPPDTKRIIVPSGSGLVAAGVLAGCARYGLKNTVVVVATSTMLDFQKVLLRAGRASDGYTLPCSVFTPATSSYNDYAIQTLPDGTPLDPFYSAKSIHMLMTGDLLWPPGLRPVCSMPKDCQEKFKYWRGP